MIFFSKDDLGSRDFVSDFETAHDLFKLDVEAPGAIQFDDAIINGQAATEVTVTADFDGVAGNETLTLELAPLGQRARRSVPLMKLAPAVAPAGQAMPPLAVAPMDPARLRVLLALTLSLVLPVPKPPEEPLALLEPPGATGDAGTARAAGAAGAAGGEL